MASICTSDGVVVGREILLFMQQAEICGKQEPIACAYIMLKGM
jgi:hypothetical protein